MLFLKATLFTILVPGTAAGFLPYIISSRWPDRLDLGIVHSLGYLLIAVGILLYGACALLFLTEGSGTPTIWFTRPLRTVLGEEPRTLVVNGMYQRSRNPMYLGVTAIAFGEALSSGNVTLFCYTATLLMFFHSIVVLVEEPHLKARDGERYALYCSKVPRWLGFRTIVPESTPKS